MAIRTKQSGHELNKNREGKLSGRTDVVAAVDPQEQKYLVGVGVSAHDSGFEHPCVAVVTELVSVNV